MMPYNEIDTKVHLELHFNIQFLMWKKKWWIAHCSILPSSDNELNHLFVCQHLHLTDGDGKMCTRTKRVWYKQIRKRDWGNCSSDLKVSSGSILASPNSPALIRKRLPPSLAVTLPTLRPAWPPGQMQIHPVQLLLWHSTCPAAYRGISQSNSLKIPPLNQRGSSLTSSFTSFLY